MNTIDKRTSVLENYGQNSNGQNSVQLVMFKIMFKVKQWSSIIVIMNSEVPADAQLCINLLERCGRQEQFLLSRQPRDNSGW